MHRRGDTEIHKKIDTCQNLALDVRYLFGCFYLCEVPKWTIVSFFSVLCVYMYVSAFPSGRINQSINQNWAVSKSAIFCIFSFFVTTFVQTTITRKWLKHETDAHYSAQLLNHSASS